MDVKLLSLELFAQCKPTCVELSQEVAQPQPNFQRIGQLLSQLLHILQDHHQQHKNQGYILARNLADYVFFPLSGLLRHLPLPQDVTTYVLAIIQFLFDHSWNLDRSHTPEFTEQLVMLTVNLCGPDTQNKPRSFQHATFALVLLLVRLLPPDAFLKSDQGFSQLSKIITIDLNTLDLFQGQCTAQEDVDVTTLALEVLKQLFTRRVVDPEAMAQVLPGVVSKLVKFTKNVTKVHYSVVTLLITVLKLLISKVFSDRDLNATYVVESDPRRLWQQQAAANADAEGFKEETKVEIHAATEVRTQSWLTATATQLKLSLMVLFKNIAHSQEGKPQAIKPLYRAVISFFGELWHTSFYCLFTEIYNLAVDVVSLFEAMTTEGDAGEGITAVEMMSLAYHEEDDIDNRRLLITKLLKQKLPNLIDTKFAPTLQSSEDVKVLHILTSIRLQLEILHRVMTDNSGWWPATLARVATVLCDGVQDQLDRDNKPKRVNRAVEHQVVLPSHIDQENLAQISTKSDPVSAATEAYNHSLVTLSKTEDILGEATTKLSWFNDFYSDEVEAAMERFLQAVGALATRHQVFTEVIDQLLSSTPPKGINLWAVNHVSQLSPQALANFDVNEFLAFDDDEAMEEDESDENNHVMSLSVTAAEDLIDDLHRRLLGGGSSSVRFGYGVALDVLGSISALVSKDQYQQLVLMDYLYPMLEALTFPGDIHTHAAHALTQVAQQFYDGLMAKLITDNLDYLVDAITVRLNSGDLTPLLPGLLLVVIKLCGPDLLGQNMLGDVFSLIFVAMDLYHGYPVAMEGFFLVFHEVVKQISRQYVDPTPKIEDAAMNESSFAPWGMSNSAQLAKFVEDNHHIAYPEYDSTKEYFTRPRDAPFSEMVDSDDEEDEDDELGDEPPSTDVVEWQGPVPQSTWQLALSIFTYGFKLLSQPHRRLKHLILQTLKSVYPILATNYNKVLPVITANWNVLITMIAGADALHDDDRALVVSSSSTPATITAAVDLAVDIIHSDDQRERRLLSRQFNDSWPRLQPSLTANPRYRSVYSGYIMAGVNAYSRMIDDVTKCAMVEYCCDAGESKATMCREAQAIAWVYQKGLLA